MRFELVAVTDVLLTHVNVRREKHGEENVPALDMSFRKEGGNELLDLLDPEIRTTIYCNRDADAGQALMPNVIAVLPNLRLPKMEQKHTYGGKDKYGGYRFVLDYGLGDEQSNLELSDCKVGGFRFETREGGSVTIEWQVSCAGEQLDQETRGRLTGLTMEKVHIQLFAPAVLQVIKGGKKAVPISQGAAEEDEDEEGGPAPGSAEDMFANQSQPATA